jgi:hypothetical protein
MKIDVLALRHLVLSPMRHRTMMSMHSGFRVFVLFTVISNVSSVAGTIAMVELLAIIMAHFFVNENRREGMARLRIRMKF